MVKEILVDVDSRETRVAILEDKELSEIYFERDNDEIIVGNIYKGRVADVLPGMQAAFVDVGLEKNVFLHVSDALALVSSEKRKKKLSIQDVVQPGQKIMVQITKEPLGTKGARATCDLNLPGRYLVLMSSVDHVGVSRRITDKAERKRLKSIAQEVKPNDKGVIVRTAAAYKSKEELKHDLDFLIKLWKKIIHHYYNSSAPALIHSDLSLVNKLVRDKFTNRISRMLIDDEEEYEEIQELLSFISPHLQSKVKLYDKDEPIFEYYGLESSIDEILQRKVWLDCGGYIVFDRTEALTAIDVNTGKYVGSTNLADTVLKTNIDAAKEIARQIKLRDVGGIIIIDFIDMDNAADKEEVVSVLDEELAKDKTKTTILGLTELGLVEMTRKKEKEEVEEFLQTSCPYCEGRGRVLSEDTVALKAIRKLRHLFNEHDDDAVLLEVHPRVASRLIGLGGNNLKELEKELDRHIYVKGSEELHMEDIQIVDIGTRKEIAELASPVEVGETIKVDVEETHVTNKQDGISRIEGFIIDIIEGGHLVGETIKVEITDVYRTYAKAEVVN
ncbi:MULTISPECIES: Rne/Rng family ribonuclease [unclassified Candidatus Frackibacter]|jgi:ribonuclease G|uniref:Rne/Rng family ribonuclease n=1 Tax=unclassified Candidatus Frackibacter TaxID=2648818 RepID=UPI000793401B|nr:MULTISPECIES: Rne/Rng family ribonuclease [unclassified Candidatus Frackibacter]KXS43938.1 MAG: ribonuclease G [Candidatus Frackibacter sp. T328-2]SDC40410.1 ribonuclease G [Candidatus Frackibacter sp. WG11]SEM60386.1 ribonuclease G [Candidatus Frackibacter sp. WG12]SFL61599.1 ribonuclease G [Candidatus Frackibacter sp. WG13]